MQGFEIKKKDLLDNVRKFAFVKLYRIMTLRPVTLLASAAILLAACGQPAIRQQQCVTALETSAKATTVQTVSGPVAGYIDDGV